MRNSPEIPDLSKERTRARRVGGYRREYQWVTTDSGLSPSKRLSISIEAGESG